MAWRWSRSTVLRSATRSTLRMHRELSTIFRDLQEDQEVRAAVLTGAGSSFCSGPDLKEIDSWDRSTAAIKPFVREAKQIVESMVDMETPLVCALNGPAIGLGATLAVFCDFVVAGEHARIGDPHVAVGAVAGDGGAIMWPLLIGVSRAKELLMLGDVIEAAEAHRIGLVNRVVPDDQVMSVTMGLARRLATGPTLAIQWTKMSINRLIKRELHLTLDASLAWEMHTINSEDYREAVNSFTEKRKPKFKGR